MSSKWLPRYMENPFMKNPKKGAESVSGPSRLYFLADHIV